MKGMNSRVSNIRPQSHAAKASWPVRLGLIASDDPWLTNWIAGRFESLMRVWLHKA